MVEKCYQWATLWVADHLHPFSLLLQNYNTPLQGGFE
jgi:hypothetical protein